MKFLLDDWENLKTCTLVSKLWRSACQPHVFYEILLSNEHRLRDLVNRIEETPVIGFWIRELRFTWVEQFGVGRQSGVEHQSWLNFAVKILPSKLTRLKLLEFDHFIGDSPMFELDRPFFESLSAFETVETLVIGHSFMSQHFYRAFAAAFPNLKHVHFNSLGSGRHLDLPAGLSDSGISLYVYPLNLVSIHTDSAGMIGKGFFEFVSSQSQSPSSSTTPIISTPCFPPELDLSAAYPYQIVGLFKTLAPFAANLSTLRVGLGWRHWPMGDDEAKMFGACRSLQNLELGDPGLPWCLGILHHLPSPENLTHLTYNVSFSCVTHVKNREFVSLDRYLSSPVFSGLKEVLFWYKGPLTRPVVEKKLKRVFPMLARRDLVHVWMPWQAPRYGTRSVGRTESL